MGKRSNFERVERDFYPTPESAVLPLVPHLPEYRFCFTEMCAGDGRLVEHIAKNTRDGFCLTAYDIEPRAHTVAEGDALKGHFTNNLPDYFITNPPWDRKILHPIIGIFSAKAPTWLLFDADWMHTKQSAPYMKWCHKIVSVGRVKWIPDSKMTGKDNCAWYLFDQSREVQTEFFGRT